MLDQKRHATSRQWLGALILALLVFSGTWVAAADQQPRRVVAIGDVHGELQGLLEILQEAELMDESRNWIGGDAVLVQTGDLVDRGADVRAVLDLVMDLQRQAPQHGGEVIALMGNHESMALLGDVQDASPEILASFATDDSEKLRQEGWKTFTKWMNQLARSRGGDKPKLADKKEQWMLEHPPGYFEYMRAMGPEGEYGQWLLQLPVMAKIGDTIFMHAGVSPEYMGMSLDEINELHREEFEIYVDNRAKLAKRKLIPWFYNLYEINQALVYQAQNPPIEGYGSSADHKLIEKSAADLNRMQKVLLQDSPLWYRGYTNLNEEELEAHLDQLEEAYMAHRFVVAHSPMATGSIHERLGGRVFLIDTGMLAAYYKGRPSALEIDNGRFSALYTGGERQVLVESEDDMVPASAAADNSAAFASPRPQLAVYRKGTGNRFQTVAYPPQEGEAPASMHKRVWRDPLGNQLPFETREELEQFLATAEVVSQQNIPKGVTKPKKILLEQNGIQAHAKFNYVDKSGQREKMADGTVEMYFLDSYKSDLAAYELSLLLGMESVPPGVARNIDGQDGIVQLWVEGLNTYENWLKEEGNTGTPASAYFDRQLKDMYTFDLLIRNTDRNQGNIAWDEDTNLWLIDHTRSMARDKGLRDPKSFKGVSVQLYDAMKALNEADVHQALSPYLGQFEVKALMQRRDKLIKLIDQQIKKNGRDEVVFDYTAPPKGMVISYDDAAP